MPPKKRKGSNNQEEEEEGVEIPTTVKPEAAKRGRGRPKKKVRIAKQPVVSKDEEGEELEPQPEEQPDAEEQPAEKRSRGRPKRAATSDDPAPKKPRAEKPPSEESKSQVKQGRGRPKRTATASDDVDAPQSVTDEAATGSEKESTATKIPNTTDFSQLDFSSDAQAPDGRQWNLKFSSWNVNGVRAWLKNKALQYIATEDPDVFCLQETKCAEDDLPKKQLTVEGYHSYWSSADKKGYSGTGVYCKKEPLNVTYGMGIDKHDSEGRLITLEFDQFYFITTYVPNAGEKLKRIDYRTQEWDVDFRAYLKDLDSKKPLILSGDLNVAYQEIDLANPKGNAKTPGFTKEEREGFGTLLSEGFLDTFRELYPDKKEAYSYWGYRTNARPRNKGWRLDYFVVSKRFMSNVCDSLIRSEVYGSDHCPVVLLAAV